MTLIMYFQLMGLDALQSVQEGGESF